MSMHHTDQRRAVARVGHELERRGWTILGYKEDRSEAMTDYYDPERWDGVATHPDRAGFVACVRVSPYTVQCHSGRDGWPTFHATPKGKAWHLEQHGPDGPPAIVAQGVGLRKCASYDEEEAHQGVRRICDAIERNAELATARSKGQSEPPSNETVDSVRVKYDRDWTWVFLPARPDRAVTDRLGRNGMGGHYSSRRRGWFFRRRVPGKELAWLVGEQQADATETKAETEFPDPIGTLYRDWLSVTNGDESAYPSVERLAQYARWGRELLASGSRADEGADFRRFCRVRVEGKARHLDLASAGNAYRDGGDCAAPAGWAFLAEPEAPSPVEVPTVRLAYAVEGGKIVFAGPGWRIETTYTDPAGIEHVNAWYLYRDPPDGLAYTCASTSLSDLLGRAPESLGVRLVTAGCPEDMPDHEPDTYLERKAGEEAGGSRPAGPTGMECEAEDLDPAWLNEEGKIRAVEWEIPYSECGRLNSTAYGSWEALYRATKAAFEARLAKDRQLGWYYKTDFRVTYADGHAYRGRMDIGDSAYDYDVGRHILRHNRFYAGQWRPDHVSEEQYRDALQYTRSRADADPARYARFLERYEIVAYSDGEPPVVLDFADDGLAVSFSREGYAYRLAAPYVVRGRRYSSGWKVHKRGHAGWVVPDALNPAPGSQEEWRRSLSLQAAIARLEQATGDAILLVGKPEDLPDCYPYVAEGAVRAAQAQDAWKSGAGGADPQRAGSGPGNEQEPGAVPGTSGNPVSRLPEGWHAEDVRCLLEALDRGTMVFVADHELGIPIVHQIRGARHLGMGVFEATTAEYTVRFLGGSAMRRTPNEKGWSHLTVEKGAYPYDRDAVRAKLEAWLRIAEQGEPEPKREQRTTPKAETHLDEAPASSASQIGAAERALRAEADDGPELPEEQCQSGAGVHETSQPEGDGDAPYSSEDVAAYEGRWDVYFETGGVRAVRQAVKRIDAIGVLQVAYERADRALSTATIGERRKIIRRRIHQLEKLAQAA
jgi:hypothetical protein